MKKIGFISKIYPHSDIRDVALGMHSILFSPQTGLGLCLFSMDHITKRRRLQQKARCRPPSPHIERLSPPQS
jgi:hypothetical protein